MTTAIPTQLLDVTQNINIFNILQQDEVIFKCAQTCFSPTNKDIPEEEKTELKEKLKKLKPIDQTDCPINYNFLLILIRNEIEKTDHDISKPYKIYEIAHQPGTNVCYLYRTIHVEHRVQDHSNEQ